MRMSNLLILSSGGNGQVAIPLLKQIEPSRSAQIEQTPKTKGALFLGKVNNLRPARLKALNEVRQLPNQLSKQIETYHGDKVCSWRTLSLLESVCVWGPRSCSVVHPFLTPHSRLPRPVPSQWREELMSAHFMFACRGAAVGAFLHDQCHAITTIECEIRAKITPTPTSQVAAGPRSLCTRAYRWE